MCSQLVSSCKIRRAIAAAPRWHCARPICCVSLDSICSCNVLAYVYKPKCYHNVLCCRVFCLQSSGVNSAQCRTAVQPDTVWRMQTLRIRTFWEVALCRRVTVPVVWKASSSPVTALDTFKTSGTTHLGHSATYQRTWIMRNTSENHKSPWYLLIQSQIVPNFTKPHSSLPCSQQSARFSSLESD